MEETEHHVFVPPDGGWGWVVVVAAFFCNFVADGILFTFGIFLETLSEDFGVTIGTVTIIGSVNTGFHFIVGPFVSAMVNKFGFRIVACVGGLVSAASYAGSSLGKNLIPLIITNGVCAGIGLGMIYVPSTIVVGFYFEKWRAIASGLATCGSGIGTLALPPVLTFVMDRHGWQTSYLLISCLMLTVSLISLFFRPLKPIRVVSTPGPSVYPKQQTTLDRNVGFCCLCCCCCQNKQLDNRQFPTTDQVVNVDRMMIEDVIYESSDSETPSVLGNATSDTSVTSAESKKGKGKTVDEEKKTERKRKCRRFNRHCVKIFHNIYTCKACKHEPETRPLYRDDIFYHQSLHLVKKYQTASLLREMPDTSKDVHKRVDYHLSVTRTVSKREKNPESDVPEHDCFCSLPVARTLVTMLDMSLLKSPAFQIFSWSGLVAVFGYMIPFLYIKDRAIKHGIDKDLAVWLLSTIGLANTFGRILSGALPSMSRISVTFYSYFSLIVGGIFTAASGIDFMMDSRSQFFFAAVYGWSGSCIASLRPVIVVELFGLENLTNAFGLQLMFMGIGSFGGMMTAGVILDKTQSYNAVFYMSGGCLIFSGLLLTILKCTRKWEKKRGILA